MATGHTDSRWRRIALIAGAWTLAGILLAVQAWLSYALRGAPIAWSRTLAIWLAWAGAWAVLTPAILWLAHRVPLRRTGMGRALGVHAIAGMAFVAANLGLFAIAAPWVGSTLLAPTWSATFGKLFGTTFLLDLPVYWLIVGGASARDLAREARERERRVLRLETQLADARLLALRAQLEPHFLFNALNTIAVLMREDVDAAERVLVLLGNQLRRALDASDDQEARLGDELAFLEAYLAIEHARFADRLSYRIDVPPELLEARVPSFVLQPLAENAVRHGIAQRAAPGHIEIAATQADGALHLSVRDDGPGFADDARDGVGLGNTRARLTLLYGERHTFRIGPAPGGGALVELSIPWRSAP